MKHLNSTPDSRSPALRDMRVVISEPSVFLAFDVMKRIPARYIIERAMLRGDICRGTVVVDTTSGSFGVGLAEVCHEHRLELHLISDPSINGKARVMCEMLGTIVHVVEVPDASGNYQRPRLSLMQEVARNHSDVFFPKQYDNEDNPRSYGEVARLIVDEEKVRPDIIIGTVGSSGSSRGLLEGFRSLGLDPALIGVDTPGSVLFGDSDRERRLRGLGNSVRPKILRPDLYNEVHWVPFEVAKAGVARLYRNHLLFQGMTSGAAYATYEQVGARNPKACILVVLPDSGDRYISDLHDAGAVAEAAVTTPRITYKSPQCDADWCYKLEAEYA